MSLSYEGDWGPTVAMDWSAWAAFFHVSFYRFFRTVEMIPILLLEIINKVTWLLFVALPLWQKGELTSSNTDGLIFPFILVIIPIVAVSWGSVFNRYVLGKRAIRREA